MPESAKSIWTQKGWRNKPLKLQFQSFLTQKVYFLIHTFGMTVHVVMKRPINQRASHAWHHAIEILLIFQLFSIQNGSSEIYHLIDVQSEKYFVE